MLEFPLLVGFFAIFLYHPDAWHPEPINDTVITAYQANKNLLEELLVDFEFIKKIFLDVKDIIVFMLSVVSFCVIFNIFIIMRLITLNVTKEKK